MLHGLTEYLPVLWHILNNFRGVRKTRNIRDNLKIASKISEGWFRFLCPNCGEFDTAVNPRTNLARCFRCEKNFNTIDMVMTVERLDFVAAVEYLQALPPGPEREPSERLGRTNAAIRRLAR